MPALETCQRAIRWTLNVRTYGNQVNKLTYAHVQFSDHFYTIALYEVRNWLPEQAKPFEWMFSLHVRTHFVRFVVRYDYCNSWSRTAPKLRMRGALLPLPPMCAWCSVWLGTGITFPESRWWDTAYCSISGNAGVTLGRAEGVEKLRANRPL